MANGCTRKWENSEEGKEWQKEYHTKNPHFSVKIRKDSGILEALDEACLVNNVSRVEYLRIAVAERLEEEGYEMGYKTSSTNNA